MQYLDLRALIAPLFALCAAFLYSEAGAQELSCPASSAVLQPTLPIFPGAQGFGTTTAAGSGRHLSTPCTRVFRVNNLQDRGAGSLRACLEATGPRVCVFEVSGVLRAQDTLRVRSPYLTVAGQTAPSPGFIVRGANISIETSDVLIQHLRMRVGDDPRPSCCAAKSCSASVICSSDPKARDGITIYNPTTTPLRNIVIDHLSVSWALDEGISINSSLGDVEAVTVAHSIISSGLDMSIHPEAQNELDPGHSKAFLVNGGKMKNLSFHHSLLAHNADRNIRVAISDSIAMEYVNNVVYNWGRGKGVGRTIEGARPQTTALPLHLMDIVGNTYQSGVDTFCPETTYQSSICQTLPGGIDTELARQKLHYILRVGSGISGGLQPDSRYFVLNNLGPTRTSDKSDEWDVVDRKFFQSTTNTLVYPSVRASSSVASSRTIRVQERGAAYNEVLATAGARPWERDIVDAQVINDVLGGTGTIINCVAPDGTERCKKNAGGWPIYASRLRPLSLPAAPNGDDDKDGYTNLEEWLHSFIRP